MRKTERYINISAWSLSAVVSLLAIWVWVQTIHGNWNQLSIYQLFPVLGLLAFSLMWTHYIVAVIRQYFEVDKKAVLLYFNVTSILVLIALVLHPSLLVYQLFRDGFGLPPFSYERVYGWLTLIGTASLLVFLAYELRRIYGERPWWKYLEYLSDVAMLAIFYHGLQLGTQTHISWFRKLWYFYGITLIGALLYSYSRKFTAKSQSSPV